MIPDTAGKVKSPVYRSNAAKRTDALNALSLPEADRLSCRELARMAGVSHFLIWQLRRKKQEVAR